MVPTNTRQTLLGVQKLESKYGINVDCIHYSGINRSLISVSTSQAGLKRSRKSLLSLSYRMKVRDKKIHRPFQCEWVPVPLEWSGTMIFGLFIMQIRRGFSILVWHGDCGRRGLQGCESSPQWRACLMADRDCGENSGEEFVWAFQKATTLSPGKFRPRGGDRPQSKLDYRGTSSCK